MFELILTTHPDTAQPDPDVADSSHGAKHKIKYQPRHQDVIERENSLGIQQHDV